MVRRFAVVPSRNRPSDLRDCLAAVGPQVDLAICVDNRSDPPVRAEDHCPNVRVVTYADDPPNLSTAWNLGIDLARSYARGVGAQAWSVALVNDDAICPPGWFEAVDSTMRKLGGAAGCSAGGLIDAPLVHREPGPVDLRLRLAGWAFLLRGELGLRADERMAWWYADNDLSWRAAVAGGAVLVPGYPVEHRHPDESTVGVLAEQAGRDRATFAAKWGRTPW